ncbi:MAG: hypothetical protein HOP28_09545 [Gemmatimonadales bacterium]|nr:hypothetical protein [Gemmatimonadales bacterium]
MPQFENRRTGTENGIVVVVRDHLRTVLNQSSTPFPCRYACLIHPRRRSGEEGFGVITLAGESLPLTVTLLESLKRMPTLLEGTDPVVLGAADEEDAMVPGPDGASWHEPLPVNRLMLWHGVAASDSGSLRNRTGIMLTPTAAGPRLTLLAAERPVGWPA